MGLYQKEDILGIRLADGHVNCPECVPETEWKNMTEDIPEIIKLRDKLHDLLIEYVAFLRKHGMKTKLKRTWTDLISED